MILLSALPKFWEYKPVMNVPDYSRENKNRLVHVYKILNELPRSCGNFFLGGEPLFFTYSIFISLFTLSIQPIYN
jgi:hypothetical protein